MWIALLAGALSPLGAQQPRTAVIGTPHGAPVDEARAVRGRVVLGSRERLQPLASVWVVLHRVGTDRAAPLDSMRTDAAGRYAFAYRTSGDARAVYFVSCMHAGVAYFTAPLATRIVTGEDAEIVVHDSTSAPIPIRVRGRHLVIAAPDTADRRPILEVYELSNDSTLTRVAAGARGAVWQAPLLAGAANGAVGQADFSADAVRFDDGVVRVAAPFAPGLKQFSFSYDVPVSDALTLTLDASADVLEVLVEDALGRAEGGGLAAQGPTVTGGRTFARFVAQDVPAGTTIRVSAPSRRSVSQGQLRILVVMTALGAALLMGLARSMYRRSRRGRGNARRSAEALRAELAALDAAFAAIASPTAEQKADHWQARAHLAKTLSDAVAREQGMS